MGIAEQRGVLGPGVLVVMGDLDDLSVHPGSLVLAEEVRHRIATVLDMRGRGLRPWREAAVSARGSDARRGDQVILLPQPAVPDQIGHPDPAETVAGQSDLVSFLRPQALQCLIDHIGELLGVVERRVDQTQVPPAVLPVEVGDVHIQSRQMHHVRGLARVSGDGRHREVPLLRNLAHLLVPRVQRSVAVVEGRSRLITQPQIMSRHLIRGQRVLLLELRDRQEPEPGTVLEPIAPAGPAAPEA
ncbi:hypothetical protein BCY76_008375 [Nesterenkonia sp. PF2B19]|nr:hypothetical protein BCY76_008375 [Nesterenkonia sp. PF2B19]